MANLKLPMWGMVDKELRRGAIQSTFMSRCEPAAPHPQLGPNIIHQGQGTMAQVVNANN